MPDEPPREDSKPDDGDGKQHLDERLGGADRPREKGVHGPSLSALGLDLYSLAILGLFLLIAWLVGWAGTALRERRRPD